MELLDYFPTIADAIVNLNEKDMDSIWGLQAVLESFESADKSALKDWNICKDMHDDLNEGSLTL